MSSIKSTLGALLGTVSSTATVVTSTLNAASTGAGMLNAYADHHAKQQAKDYAVLSLSSDAIAAEKAATAAVERARAVKAMNLSAEELALFASVQASTAQALSAV